MPTEEMTDEEVAEEERSDESAIKDGADDDGSDSDAEALEELEAEELDMLTEDETSETLVVDEAAEMRQIRREELAMDRRGAHEAADDEFVCARCFLVLKTSQLADGKRKICRDCAA